MENAAIDAANLAGSAPPTDLTIVGLFMQADIIVKIVILILVLASFWTWAIIFDKVIRIRTDRLLCSGERCQVMLGRDVLVRDAAHPTREGSRYIGRLFEPLFANPPKTTAGG